MNQFEQFSGLDVPSDIKPLPPFKNKDDLQIQINTLRSANKRPPIDLSGKLKINYNCPFFRQDEINIQTIDLDFNYEPDFNYMDTNDEIDPWRKTCRLKAQFQRFIGLGVDQIRSEGLIQKMHICENLTFFEDSFKMLKDDGVFIVKYMDLIAYFQHILTVKSSIKELEKLEKTIFSPSDPTGQYYNKTLLTLDRIKYYLNKVGFVTVNKDEENSDQFHTQLTCLKA